MVLNKQITACASRKAGCRFLEFHIKVVACRILKISIKESGDIPNELLVISPEIIEYMQRVRS